MRVESSAALLRTVLEPPIGVLHDEVAGRTEDLMLHVQCGAERRAAIVRGRLDVDAFERCLALDLAVHRAVQRHTASQAQIGQAGLRCELAQQREHDVLEQRLQRRRDVLMLHLERCAGLPARTEELFELGREDVANHGRAGLPRHVDPFAVVDEVGQIELEALWCDTHETAQRVDILGFAVRCEPHHLELVTGTS
ncbi:MAG: hypothetical protein QM736_01680 [Vicinamibacterales bacterium]